MNRCYRLVWDRNTERWVIAHEHARSRGKRSGTRRVMAAAVAAAFAGMRPSAYALPTGGQVSAGYGNIAQPGNAMTVTQTRRTSPSTGKASASPPTSRSRSTSPMRARWR